MRKKLFSMVAALAVGFGAFAQTTIQLGYNQYGKPVGYDYQVQVDQFAKDKYVAKKGDIITVHIAGTVDSTVTDFQVAIVATRPQDGPTGYWDQLSDFKTLSLSLDKGATFDYTVDIVITKDYAIGTDNVYQKLVFDAKYPKGGGTNGTSVSLTLTTYDVKIDPAVPGVTTITSNGAVGEYRTTYADSVLNKVIVNGTKTSIDTVREGDIVQVKISGKALTGIKEILSGVVNESEPKYWSMISGYNQWAAAIEPGTSFSYVVLDTIKLDTTGLGKYKIYTYRDLLDADDSKGKFQNLVLLAKADSNVKIQDLVLRAQKVTPATSVVVSGGNAITAENGTLQLAAKVNAGATDTSIVWTVSNSAATIDATGKLTAKANGTVQVIATVFDGSKVADTIDVTITGQAGGLNPVTSVTITGEDKITAAGGKITLTAAANADATEQGITWKTEGAAATFNETTGDVTAVSNGTFTVIALSKEVINGVYITDTLRITITGQYVPVTGITATSSVRSINSKDQTITFTATVSPADATDKTVTWAITSGADYATIDANGVLSVKATAKGTQTVKVTATSKDGKVVSSAVTVSLVLPYTAAKIEGSSFSFGPNPAVDVITIATEEAIKSISVANFDGSVVLSDKSGAKSFNVAGLSAGKYVVTIILANGEEVVKTIVKK